MLNTLGIVWPVLTLLIVGILLYKHINNNEESKISLSQAFYIALTLIGPITILVFAINNAFEVNLNSSEMLINVFNPLCCLVALGCAYIQINRTKFESIIENKLFRGHSALKKAVLLFVIILLSIAATELPDNLTFLTTEPYYLGFSFIIVAFIIMVLTLIFQFSVAGPMLGILICAGVGIAEFYMHFFKSMPLLPSDCLALRTAAAVAGSFEFALPASIMLSLAVTTIALMVASFIARPKSIESEASVEEPAEKDENETSKPSAFAAKLQKLMANRVACVCINLLVAAGLIGGAAYTFMNVNLMYDLNVSVAVWKPLESYQSQGFWPTFLSEVQTLIPNKPEGYSTANSDDIRDGYVDEFQQSLTPEDHEAAAQFEEIQPDVVVIMNETFADLSALDGLHSGYEGPEYFRSIDDALIKGHTYVSAMGGGTCNSEFEFLTGNSLAFIGGGVYPYQLYNFNNSSNLARQFEELGYGTHAMHPNEPANWNRQSVYKGMGFDEFLSIEDFAGAPTLRGHVTDAATYDAVLDILNENDTPQFIFDVTMQNHSGYTTEMIPEDQRTEYVTEDLTGKDIASDTNEYLDSIDASDRDLKYLMDELRDYDRPVVLVFFGDHHPWFSPDYVDALFPGEDNKVAHSNRAWNTDFIVWANYDVAGREDMQMTNLSTNFLAAEALHAVGAPLTTYQQAQLSLREDLPIINLIGYCDVDGTWRSQGEDSPSRPARQDLALLQHRHLFEPSETESVPQPLA